MIKEFNKKTDHELGELILKLKIQLLEMRFKIASGEVEGIHKTSQIRRTIATAMTVLNQRNVRVSFTTNTIQLIKDNKISAIKLDSLVIDNNNDALNKKNIDNKQQSGAIFNKAKAIDTNSDNLANMDKANQNKQSVQIRRTAKG